MHRSVMLVAFHFPPCGRSSGIQRTLKNAIYLPNSGWSPEVLTAHPRSFEHRADGQLSEIPDELTVVRASSIDTARHLSLGGRYLQAMAIPDRWSYWILAGVIRGLRQVRKHRPDVIWSTYPIASAHVIGLALHRLTGIPWVADCRDSMTEDNYPSNPKVRRAYLWIEKKMVEHATRVIFTTNGAKNLYANRYKHVAEKHWCVIPNGYDEENFRAAEATIGRSAGESARQIRLIHSGVLYPSERDPEPFFAAIRDLKAEGRISAKSLSVALRASGFEERYQRMLDEYRISDVVCLEPSIPYVQALAEMLTVDGLIIFQAANCNHQIPAKIYEYFRAGKPIFALTDKYGDTANLMQEAGYTSICDISETEDIKRTLLRFLDEVKSGNSRVLGPRAVDGYSRESSARRLADIFNEVVSEIQT